MNAITNRNEFRQQEPQGDAAILNKVFHLYETLSSLGDSIHALWLAKVKASNEFENTVLYAGQLKRPGPEGSLVDELIFYHDRSLVEWGRLAIEQRQAEGRPVSGVGWTTKNTYVFTVDERLWDYYGMSAWDAVGV